MINLFGLPWHRTAENSKLTGWDTVVLRDNILYKKRLRDDGNDAEYLILVPVVLRKEVFRQLHECVTAGHLGRKKKLTIKSRNGFTGATCIKMYPIGVGLAQPVGQERCVT